MRRAIWAFVMVAFVLAAAQPASASQKEFRGRYQVIARNTAGGGCFIGDYRNRVHVRYVNKRVREFDATKRFRYRRGKPFPWHQAGRKYKLRYDPATDSAIGVRYGPQCRWRVRLVPIDRGGPNALTNSGFRGRYRIIGRLHRGNGCPPEITSYRRPIDVRYVNRWVRQFGHPDSDSARRFRYVRGAQFPWQHTRPWHHGERYTLRYHQATDSAVGVRHGIQNCNYRVRLIPIG